MKKYENTKAYWDNVFEHFNRPFPELITTQVEKLDQAILSLGKPNMKALDFGFGSGMVLLMFAMHFEGQFTGIELSSKACDLASRLFTHYGIEDATFIEGSFDAIKNIEAASLDVFVASNILDNLTEDDGLVLLEEAYRTLKPGGSVLVKLNDFYSEAQLELHKAKKLSENLYEEDSGIYLLNLETYAWKQRFSKWFFIVDNYTLEMPHGKMKNRMFILKKPI